MYDGRLSHMVQLMGYHPSYLSLFLKSHDFLMQGNGPLPLHIRNYLAILVSGTLPLSGVCVSVLV